MASIENIISSIECELCNVEKHLEEVGMRLEEKKSDMIKCTQDKDRKEQSVLYFAPISITRDFTTPLFSGQVAGKMW